MSPKPTESDLSLPDALVNTSQSTYPLLFCGGEDRPGQVWLTHYPYTTATLILGNERSGFYYPEWSPNGQMIAYVMVDRQQPLPPVVINETNVENRFVDSDSIWIMNVGGTEKKRVSSLFTRVEFEHPNGSCDVGGGIVSFVGWSSDGKWLAFIVATTEPQPIFTLYTINLETGEEVAFNEDAGSGIVRWSSAASRIAMISEDFNRIAVFSVGDNSTVSVSLDLPPRTAGRLSNLQWQDENTLDVVIEVERGASVGLAELWRLNLANSEWEKLTDLTSTYPSNLSLTEGHELICTRDTFEIIDQRNWALAGTLNLPQGIDCNTTGILARQGIANSISFMDVIHHDRVWLINLLESPWQSEVVIDKKAMNLPDDVQLVSVSWRP
jgi:hypothetical protein